MPIYGKKFLFSLNKISLSHFWLSPPSIIFSYFNSILNDPSQSLITIIRTCFSIIATVPSLHTELYVSKLIKFLSKQQLLMHSTVKNNKIKLYLIIINNYDQRVS